MTNELLYWDIGIFFAIYLFYHFFSKKFSGIEWQKKPGFAERWSTSSKPTIGGFGFVIALTASGLFYLTQNGNEFIIYFVVLAGVGAFFTGLLDDVTGLKPLPKFAGQCMAAFVLMIALPPIPVFGILIPDMLLTFLFITGMMNSVNMLDNMDGVSAVPALTAVIFFLVCSVLIQNDEAVLFLFFMSALICFLFFNWPPSKIFMGDNGSMLLGIVLAYGGIKYCLNLNFHPGHSVIPGLGMVLLIFTIPLADSLTVTINRLSHGISPARGGKDHTTHNFVYSGLPGKFVPLLFVVVGILQLALWWISMNKDLAVSVGLPAPLQPENFPLPIPHPAIGIVFFLLYFMIVFVISRINLRDHKYSYSR